MSNVQWMSMNTTRVVKLQPLHEECMMEVWCVINAFSSVISTNSVHSTPHQGPQMAPGPGEVWAQNLGSNMQKTFEVLQGKGLLGHNMHQFHVFQCAVHTSSRMLLLPPWFGEPLPGPMQARVGQMAGETGCWKGIIPAWHQCMADDSRPGAHCFARDIGFLVCLPGGIQWCSYPAVWAQWQHLRVGMGQLCQPRPTRVKGPKLKKETMCIWCIYTCTYNLTWGPA